MAQIYNESKSSSMYQAGAVVIRGTMPVRELSYKENLHPNVAVVPPTYQRYY